MFERFTDRARRVVVLSQEEARALNHGYIGTEHILLGLLAEEDGVAGRALAAAHIEFDSTRARVLEIIGMGKDPVSRKHIPFTPRAKRVLELSLREALQLGHNYIGTEHILLGLIREGEGVAAQVLVHLGADLTTVRATVLSVLGSSETLSQAVGSESAPKGEPSGGGTFWVSLTDREREVVRLLTQGESDKEIARALSISTNTVANHKRNILQKVWLASTPDPSGWVGRAEQAGPRAHGTAACPGCSAPLKDSMRYEIAQAPPIDGEGPPARVLLLFCVGCGATIDDVVIPGDDL